MAARRGKSQARRNSGGNRLPGWAWLVLGIVLTVLVVLAAPRLLRSDQGDGFFRPKPNPDAQPAQASGDEAVVPEPGDDEAGKGDADRKPKGTQYDFYTLLPADEVAMSDAELAATARAEAERRANAQPGAASTDEDAADLAASATPEAPAVASAPVRPAEAGSDTPYILQAGAFGAASDAETVKARIALLGLGARVEPAEIQGKTVYRVRMGPYGTASELAEAKRKLANGGLPALAIKAR
jgi:cell division protein FtsN